MFRRNGYTGTGVKQVAAAAGAQLGSLYHFFPGGKEQLVEEVIRTSGPLYGDLVYQILDPYANPVTAITVAFAIAAQYPEPSDCARPSDPPSPTMARAPLYHPPPAKPSKRPPKPDKPTPGTTPSSQDAERGPAEVRRALTVRVETGTAGVPCLGLTASPASGW